MTGAFCFVDHSETDHEKKLEAMDDPDEYGDGVHLTIRDGNDCVGIQITWNDTLHLAEWILRTAPLRLAGLANASKPLFSRTF